MSEALSRFKRSVSLRVIVIALGYPSRHPRTRARDLLQRHVLERSANMTKPSKQIYAALLFCIASWSGLWVASQWWEKALAKPSGEAHISPHGCYRVQQFTPFWVLPAFFHPRAHPDDSVPLAWFPHWEIPAFFRLYDHRNGQLLGESGIYDLVHDGGPLSWGFSGVPSVSASMIEIGPNAPDCIGDEPGRH
ncbi:hypothetical protein [Pseudomonas baetica]|uniref:hypothetical protein n=1 Tax=Pseudomonas TaxID=286 RepID=UPI002871055B|nr:hypothetical protein [Pseudomonas baetica]MDR9864412.1 hypothetical protein [Pseudomonas baetica]